MYGKIKNRTKNGIWERQQQYELQICFDYKVKLHANYNPFVFLKQGIMKKSHVCFTANFGRAKNRENLHLKNCPCLYILYEKMLQDGKMRLM